MDNPLIKLATWYGALALTIVLAFFISLGLLMGYVWLRDRLTKKPEAKDPQLKIDFDRAVQVLDCSRHDLDMIQYQISVNQNAISECLDSNLPLDDVYREVNRLAAANNQLRHHLN